jgi:hypothetical protein
MVHVSDEEASYCRIDIGVSTGENGGAGETYAQLREV